LFIANQFLLERRIWTLKGNVVHVTEGNSAKLSMFHLSDALVDVVANFGAVGAHAAVRVVHGGPSEKTDGDVRVLLSEYFVCWAAEMVQFVFQRW
jgi:hypothetical protein